MQSIGSVKILPTFPKISLISRFQWVMIGMFPLLSILLLIGVSFIPDNDTIFSWYFFVSYAYGFLSVWKVAGSRLTPFHLFYLTCGLFLGGSFFGNLMGAQSSLFTLNWYYPIDLDLNESRELFRYLLLLIFGSCIGYIYTINFIDTERIKLNGSPMSTKFFKRINIFLEVLFYIILPLIIIEDIQSFFNVLKEGYVSLYLSGQTDDYSSGSGIFGTVFLILFGLAMGFGYRKVRKKYLILFILNAVVSMVIGARGSFGATILLLFWIYSLKHRVSLKQLLLAAFSGVILIITLFSFSLRGQKSSQNRDSGVEVIGEFIGGQGISLMVMETAKVPSEYPAIAYVQSFIPGSSFLYSRLTGERLASNENNLSKYMCSTVNPKIYNQGFGLGWSIMADFYLFGGRNRVGYTIWAIIFGIGIGWMERKSMTSPWIRSLLFTIITPLLMLPRASFNSFFTVIIYCSVAYVMIGIFCKLKTGRNV